MFLVSQVDQIPQIGRCSVGCGVHSVFFQRVLRQTMFRPAVGIRFEEFVLSRLAWVL